MFLYFPFFMLNLIVFVYVALQVKWKLYDDSSLFFNMI